MELAWKSPGALVDGQPWPILTQTGVFLPAGEHTVEPGPKRDGISVSDLNATLRTASAEGKRIRFRYSSDSRAIVRFDRKPGSLEVDNQIFAPDCVKPGFTPSNDCVILLPRGEHDVAAR